MLGLLRRNLYSCSPKVKEISYKTLVRPRLEYCATIWDPYQKEYIKQLEGVQRRAARFVLNRPEQRSSVSEMISYLKWEPLEHRRAASRLTFLYKSIHKLISVNTDSYQTGSSDKGVSTRIRSSISFKKIPASKECYKHSLYPRTFSEWNCLPAHVRNSPTLGTFKTNIQRLNMGEIIAKAHFQN